ncbi:hypothetical protein F2Q68_00004325 [Brassica cretica]|uniref:Uncharacterized protein n=1 Tax=Brassica cretica TaxID=69181 RepID=A0A8S9J9Y3_BRACR|nr:hypothetical protein F2Q68_00004325 [Brassica cretica]
MQPAMWSTRWKGQARGVVMHAARHAEDVVSACMTSGARGAAAHASGAMRSDTRAATRLAPDCTWRRLCSSEKRSVLVETSSSGDQSRRGSTCEGRERVRNAEVRVPLRGSWIMAGGRSQSAPKINLSFSMQILVSQLLASQHPTFP